MPKLSKYCSNINTIQTILFYRLLSCLERLSSLKHCHFFITVGVSGKIHRPWCAISKEDFFFFFYILMKCSVVPVSALDSALPWQSPCVHAVSCWEHQNQTQKWGKDWVYSLFIFHEIKLLKIEKKNLICLKSFLYLFYDVLRCAW